MKKNLTLILLFVFIAVFANGQNSVQVFQNKGTVVGTLNSIDICNHSIPSKKNIAITPGSGDETTNYDNAKARIDASDVTDKSNTNSYNRDITISGTYHNADYGGGADDCGSQANFNGVKYKTILNLPSDKNLWTVKIMISANGNKFFSTTTNFTLNITDNGSYNQSATIPLSCNYDGSFGDAQIGTIANIPSGLYNLTISFPDFGSNNTRFAKGHADGNFAGVFSLIIAGKN